MLLLLYLFSLQPPGWEKPERNQGTDSRGGLWKLGSTTDTQRPAAPSCPKPQWSLYREFYPLCFGQATVQIPPQVQQGITMAAMFWLALSQGFLPASSLLKFHFVSSTTDNIRLLFLPQVRALLLSDVSSCYAVLRMQTQLQWLPTKLRTPFAEASVSPRGRATWPKTRTRTLSRLWLTTPIAHVFFFFQRSVLTGTKTSADILAWARDITWLINPRKVWQLWLRAASPRENSSNTSDNAVLTHCSIQCFNQ